MKSAADIIIEKFGGVRPMARATGWPASTIQSWKEAGVIPARRQVEILRMAQKLGIDVSPSDFFEAA